MICRISINGYLVDNEILTLPQFSCYGTVKMYGDDVTFDCPYFIVGYDKISDQYILEARFGSLNRIGISYNRLTPHLNNYDNIQIEII